MPSQKELVDSFLDVLKQLDPNDPASSKIITFLYIVDQRLPEYLEKFKQHLQILKPNQTQLQERGKLLEKVVYLIFCGLKGATSFKSFQSAGPQYDLLVTGDNEHWMTVCKLLYLEIDQRDIVIEAKAKQTPLPDKDFARLCSIMELNLTNSGLGIFFTLKGASGFPKRNPTKRERCLKDCQLRQVLYHAKTQKYIIVLDQEDILSLGKNGSLMTLLIRKIRDICELSGLPTEPIEQFKEIDLPNHLKEFEE